MMFEYIYNNKQESVSTEQRETFRDLLRVAITTKLLNVLTACIMKQHKGRYTNLGSNKDKKMLLREFLKGSTTTHNATTPASNSSSAVMTPHSSSRSSGTSIKFLADLQQYIQRCLVLICTSDQNASTTAVLNNPTCTSDLNSSNSNSSGSTITTITESVIEQGINDEFERFETLIFEDAEKYQCRGSSNDGEEEDEEYDNEEQEEDYDDELSVADEEDMLNARSSSYSKDCDSSEEEDEEEGH